MVCVVDILSVTLSVYFFVDREQDAIFLYLALTSARSFDHIMSPLPSIRRACSEARQDKQQRDRFSVEREKKFSLGYHCSMPQYNLALSSGTRRPRLFMSYDLVSSWKLSLKVRSGRLKSRELQTTLIGRARRLASDVSLLRNSMALLPSSSWTTLGTPVNSHISLSLPNRSTHPTSKNAS